MAKSPTKTWLPAFLRFCELVRIQSKDFEGEIPLSLYEGQKRLVNSLSESVNNGVHHFVVLKSRQLGMSTVMLALDIFWLYMHPGLQGALIFDNEKNLETARATLTQMLDALEAQGFNVPVKTHNRTGLILNNGSRLQYISAGKGKNAGLGRSRALNFIHSSEASSYGDQKGLDSLEHAMSQQNPNRLYIFESTALGYNVFHDMWEKAKRDSRQKAIFIGWWSKDTQQIDKDDPEFSLWWSQSPFLDEYEAEASEIVLREYGWQITEEQWAWYRRELAGSSSEASMREEQPTHEYEAFQATGNSFFNINRLNSDIQLLNRLGESVGYRGYKYILGNKFEDLQCRETNIPDDADLKIWEMPSEHGVYVMGVDPAYGSSEERDRSTIEVFRCYADRMVQVAEYNTPIPTTRQVAVVMSHLAASYRNIQINLEITGPGGEVMNELRSLRTQVALGRIKQIPNGLNPDAALDMARWFLYSRPDSPGAGYVFNWSTSFQTKPRMMNRMRDTYDTDQLTIRSMLLLDEMTKFVQDGDKMHASGRNKDDRVIATALAVMTWFEHIMPGLMVEDRTFAREQQMQKDKVMSKQDVYQYITKKHFQDMAKHRAEADLKQLLEL